MKYFLEREYDAPLDVLVHNNFYAPLGLKNTLYNAADRIPQIELFLQKMIIFSFQKLQGYVHDEGAAMLGGVGGMPVCFQTPMKLLYSCSCFAKGVYNGKRYFDAATFDAFNVWYYAIGQQRGIGLISPKFRVVALPAAVFPG